MTEALKAELAERIAAKKVLVVVGTGVSLASTDGDKLASWKGLIANGVEHCVNLGLRDATWGGSQKKLLESDLDDLLGVAEQVSRRLGWKPMEPCGGDWNRWLRNTVGGLRAKHPELIEAIRNLGTPIATLNYDNLLTDLTGRRPITWHRAERWLPVLQGGDQAILHLHGHWDYPSSVILGIRSYDAVSGQGLAQHLQRALTSWLSLAFIGCSATLEDPNFSALLTWMGEHLSGAEHSHYLLIRENEPLPVDVSRLREARVVPLHYGKEHTDLLPFIHDLAPKSPNKTRDASIERKGHNDFAPTPTSPNNIDHESEPKSGGFEQYRQANIHGFSTKLYKDGDLNQKFFISYRRSAVEDQRLAHFLFERLKRAGYEPFIDVGTPVGTDWSVEIDRRIDWCDALIVLLSEQSIRSEMVQAEVRRAHHRRRADGRPRILPVRVRYGGPLDYELDSYLGHLQYVLWQEQDDNEQVAAAILSAGTTDQRTSILADSVSIQGARPQSAIDPRVVFGPPGGTIPEDDAFYVRRAADDNVDLLAPQFGRTLVIKAPRQMGKSSLLCRYLAACRIAGKLIAYIDFQRFSDHTLDDYSAFLAAFAEELVDELGLTMDRTILAFPSQQKFIHFVRDRILSRIGEAIVLALDEVDRVLGRPWQCDFFAMLRSLHNNRAMSKLWRKLDLALVISTEPYLLIDRADQSPFNVVPAIELSPFNSLELSEVNVKYGSPLSPNDLDNLQLFLNGHPYLIRYAFYRLGETKGLTVRDLIESGPRQDGPFVDHLRAKLFAVQRNPALLTALKNLIVQRIPPDLTTYWKLYGAGLVTRNADGAMIPFNLLYTRFFRDLR